MSELSGATVLALKKDEGYVIASFPKPVQWVKLEPGQASDVAEEMARLAESIRSGKDPAALKRDLITEQRYRKLINRAKIVLPQLRAKQRSDEYIGRWIVDMVLSEVSGE